MLGLKRGEVALFDHQAEWEEIARVTIKKLKDIFGDKAVDIQHIGSTAIRAIKAKPIIDIAVGVESFEVVIALINSLENNGFRLRHHAVDDDMLFVCGDFENDIRTHHIHVVEINSSQWYNYINFRDYLNINLDKSKIYERLKMILQKRIHMIVLLIQMEKMHLSLSVFPKPAFMLKLSKSLI